MADIHQDQAGRISKHSKPRSTKAALRVDLTPMVDLAFLLISFFMLTTVLSASIAMDYDKRISEDNDPVSECRVLNILIDSFDRVYTYEGMELDSIQKSSFGNESSIRSLMIKKAQQVKASCGTDRSGKSYPLVCLIKLLPGARYQNMIDIMDEMKITGTGFYSLQEPVEEEIALVRTKESVQF